MIEDFIKDKKQEQNRTEKTQDKITNAATKVQFTQLRGFGYSPKYEEEEGNPEWMRRRNKSSPQSCPIPPPDITTHNISLRYNEKMCTKNNSQNVKNTIYEL